MSILENEKTIERGKISGKSRTIEDGIKIGQIHCGEIFYISKRFDWARINFPTEREKEREIDPSTNSSRVLPLRYRYSLSQCLHNQEEKERKEKKKKNIKIEVFFI